MKSTTLILLLSLTSQLITKNKLDFSYQPTLICASNSSHANQNSLVKIQVAQASYDTQQFNYFRQQLIQQQALNALQDQNCSRQVNLPPVFKSHQACYTDPFWYCWSNPDFHNCQAKFANWPKSKIFHQIRAYRYAGFREYVDSLPEFLEYAYYWKVFYQ